jgi:hypothetical protein
MSSLGFDHSPHSLTDLSQSPQNGPCPVNDMQQTNISSANPVVELDVDGHNVTLTLGQAYLYAAAYVVSYISRRSCCVADRSCTRQTVDGVLRNATGADDPKDLFGPGVERSYDYLLETPC